MSVNEKIVNYYLLCTTRIGGKTHIVDALQDTQLNIVFTKKEIDLFLRKHDKHYIAREIVVGGSEQTGRARVIVI